MGFSLWRQPVEGKNLTNASVNDLRTFIRSFVYKKKECIFPNFTEKFCDRHKVHVDCVPA